MKKMTDKEETILRNLMDEYASEWSDERINPFERAQNTQGIFEKLIDFIEKRK